MDLLFCHSDLLVIREQVNTRTGKEIFLSVSLFRTTKSKSLILSAFLFSFPYCRETSCKSDDVWVTKISDNKSGEEDGPLNTGFVLSDKFAGETCVLATWYLHDITCTFSLERSI